MLHPLFSLLINRPELVADHVAGYAALVQQEASSAGAEVLRRSLAWCLATLGLAVFVALAGGALMLGVLHGQFHWVLVAVPGVALVLAGAAFSAARKPMTPDRFNEIKSQLHADMQTLRSVGEERHGR
ncbi:MAG TPA: hypothetical protein VLJ57_12040 [Burkholderiaceae bacterium]|nr:hypothetical protein [Burkholderiaceae bacterium]